MHHVSILRSEHEPGRFGYSSRGYTGVCGGRLESLLRSSWPNAEEIGKEMYGLVDILMHSGVDQKWFSIYAEVEGEEVMLTTPGIRAVRFDFSMSFCDNNLTKNYFLLSHYRP